MRRLVCYARGGEEGEEEDEEEMVKEAKMINGQGRGVQQHAGW